MQDQFIFCFLSLKNVLFKSYSSILFFPPFLNKVNLDTFNIFSLFDLIIFFIVDLLGGVKHEDLARLLGPILSFFSDFVSSCVYQSTKSSNICYIFIEFLNIHSYNRLVIYFLVKLINIIKGIKIMQYQRTPPDFMKDIFIAPHSFNDPEHPEHGQYVNDQMKNDLYHDSLYKITASEFSLFGNREEEIEVQKITKCSGPDPYHGLAAKLNRSKVQDKELIACQDWSVARKAGPNSTQKQVSTYRIKIYQSKGDLFYSQVHPPTLWKIYKSFIFN